VRGLRAVHLDVIAFTVFWDAGIHSTWHIIITGIDRAFALTGKTNVCNGAQITVITLVCVIQ